MLSPRQRYYLPVPVYTILKKFYFNNFKSYHEHYLLQKIDGQNILLVQTNSGETLLLANILRNKNTINKFDMICFTNQYQKEIFDLYFSVYKFAFITSRVLHRPRKSKYILKNKKITCCFGNDFWHEYFLPDKHIKNAMLDFLQIDRNSFIYGMPLISEKEKDDIKNKLSQYKIQYDNFIFCNISAQSMSHLSNHDIKKLYTKLHEEGYDTFINDAIMEKEFSLKEIFIVAGFAKQIVSLRSGLTELLCLYDIPIHTIYTNGTLNNFYEHYNLKEYGFKNNSVIEYQYNSHTIDLILKNIGRVSYAGS